MNGLLAYIAFSVTRSNGNNVSVLMGRMPHPPSASKSGIDDKHSIGPVEQQSQGLQGITIYSYVRLFC